MSCDICFVQESRISDPNLYLPLSLAVGLVVSFGPRLLGDRVGLLTFLINLILKSFLGVRILTVVF